MGYVSRYFWAGIFLASLIAPSTQAGGLYLYELGTPDVGTAAAGWAARAQDAATVFTNPAGRVSGTYDDTSMSFINFYLNWKF
jgi:long-subunit fatty acid transport protein